jgi:hypothetical protein
MIHPLIALTWQIGLGLITGNWWLGVASSLFFAGREITQAEYRYIEHYGSGLRANMPWWGRFDPRVWTFHSLTDWLLPLGLTVAVASLAGAL